MKDDECRKIKKDLKNCQKQIREYEEKLSKIKIVYERMITILSSMDIMQEDI